RSSSVHTWHFHSEKGDRFWWVELTQQVERYRGHVVLVVRRVVDGRRADVGREVVQADLDADVAAALVLHHEAHAELGREAGHDLLEAAAVAGVVVESRLARLRLRRANGRALAVVVEV